MVLPGLVERELASARAEPDRRGVHAFETGIRVGEGPGHKRFDLPVAPLAPVFVVRVLVCCGLGFEAEEARQRVGVTGGEDPDRWLPSVARSASAAASQSRAS